MKKHIHFSCPLDCFDVCAMVATVVDGRVVKITGDRTHPLTAGHICTKGKKLLQRLYHPDRLLCPREKAGGRWQNITWKRAIATIADALADIRRTFGTSAVLHYSDSGYNGVVKSVDSIFFNAYGGVTVPRGSLCWGAGMAAQTYDFGDVKCHDPADIVNARTIVIWGRNPLETNAHLARNLLAARKNGARVILIDPIKTPSARLTDLHIAPRPATDAALALGVARAIIEKGAWDRSFVDRCTVGFEAFKATARAFTPSRVAALTGVPPQIQENLTRIYAGSRPAAIWIGYGLQRYTNGGNTVRCIDALAALTGNIGIPGGGANYANKSVSGHIGGLLQKTEALARNKRTFSVAKFGEFLENATSPPIRCLVVTKANPLVQAPDVDRTVRAFARVPFKIVFDMFMTDTARHADLVLPCTSVLEEEDLFVSPMFSDYINYSRRAVAPPEGMMGEFAFFRALARKMNITDFPDLDPQDFIAASLKPLTDRFQVDLDRIRQGHFKIPGSGVPWQDGRFATPSKKYEFFSAAARAEGQSPVATFVPPTEPTATYPLRLITPHCKHSLHSQHFAFVSDRPTVYANTKTCTENALADGGWAEVRSEKGRIQAKVKQDNGVPDGTIKIYEGWWHRSGSVNRLTENRISDMGEQAAFNDCWCRIAPVPDPVDDGP